LKDGDVKIVKKVSGVGSRVEGSTGLRERGADFLYDLGF
jgi:hypothetical protein